jgi:hypothetical protein
VQHLVAIVAETFMTDLSIFEFACFGGFLAEVLKWYRLRESVNFPDYAKGPVYWIITLAVIVGGGGLAYAYGPQVVTSKILAVNIGASAPLIIQTLFSAAPHNLPRGFAADEPDATPLNFLAGR